MHKRPISIAVANIATNLAVAGHRVVAVGCMGNGIAFDTRVIQFILSNHSKWYNFSGLEICKIVYEWTQKLIDDSNYGLFKPYREYYLEIKPIDVYLILGLDNEARRSSLKKCQFQLDYKNVEEMPIHHSTEDLTEEQIQEIKSYRRNDVLSTLELYYLTRGLTEHPIYKGNDQIQLRLDISEEFGIDCLNYSDIKIGDELLKRSYAKELNKEVKDLPRKGFFRKEIKLKHCIPKFVEFQTPELKKLLEETAKELDIDRILIKKLLKLNYPDTEIKKIYNISSIALHKIRTNKTWKDVPEYTIQENDVLFERNYIRNNKYDENYYIQIIKDFLNSKINPTKYCKTNNLSDYCRKILTGNIKPHLLNSVKYGM